jgi:hypothetical protein
LPGVAGVERGTDLSHDRADLVGVCTVEDRLPAHAATLARTAERTVVIRPA